MTKKINYVLVLLFAVLLVPAAYAVTLQEAKEQGLVGEQRDGYVGLVVQSVPADVTQLVRDVNNQRLQRYQQIAQENGIGMAQVTSLAYQRAVEATQPGHFYQMPNGAWVRK
jgi:uncharacterized protein